MSIITVDSYRKMCDGCYVKGHGIPEGEVIHAEMEDVQHFFDVIKHFPEKKIILISSGSDYGLNYQVENPINADLLKHANSIDWNQVVVSPEYVKIGIWAAEYSKCNIRDKFSVKIDNYTCSTFNEIPRNIVKWFVSNGNVNENRIEHIPYGVNIDTEDNGILKYTKNTSEKTKLVYANFRLNCLDRVRLRNYLLTSTKETWLTFVDTNIPVQDYYKDTSEHIFSICPNGNGLDSYRIHESILLGTIPILSLSRWSKNMASLGIPCVISENLCDLNEEVVNKLKRKAEHAWIGWNGNVLTKEYWKGKIEEAKKLLRVK